MSRLIESISDSLIVLTSETKQSVHAQEELKNHLKDYKLFEKYFSKIPFQKYQAWIPNNAGILNWIRIGSEYEAKQRYLFKKGRFENSQPKIIYPIEIVDTDVDINDSVEKRKGLYPIFVSNISFKNKTNDVLEDVISGSGHLVNNGMYVGESILAFFEKKDYLALKELKIDEKLAECYSSLDVDEFNKIYDSIEYFFKKNKPINTYRVNYKVEARGKITLDAFSIEINKYKMFGIEHIISEEGYKSISQLMYGQIKKVFHGDSHHNHKDDVILKVYNANEVDVVIPIKQMVEHMKGLEKIEKNRHRMNCKDYIPSYVHEADGILAYIEMYYENYVLNNDMYKAEGERYVKSARTIHKSLKAIVDRNSEIYDLTINYKRKGRNILTEFPLYLLLLAFITFLFPFGGGLDLSNNSVLDYIKCTLKLILENTTFFVYTILILFLIIFKNFISVHYCKCIFLHKDYRPKDKHYAYSMNSKFLYKHRLNIQLFCFILFFLAVAYFSYYIYNLYKLI